MTPLRPMPVCPRCQRNDQVEEEEQSGSSQRWFICNRCHHTFRVPLRPPPDK